MADKSLVVLSPGWKESVRYAGLKRLGLTFPRTPYLANFRLADLYGSWRLCSTLRRQGRLILQWA